MKKLLFSMLAMAAVLFTACTQEDDFRGNGNGDEVTVAFSVEMPTAATRAYTPGECIDELVCVVFENVNGVATERYRETISGNNRFTFTPQLINGRTYDIVFWAQNTGAYDVTNATAIKRNAGNFTEAEYDAFTYVVKNFQVTEENLAGNNVTLGRPFAQLNIGVTDNDLDKVIYLGYTPTNVVLTVDNAATEFNALTGKQVNADETVSYTLHVPGEKITVAGVDYNLLSQCFVLLEEGWPNANVAYTIKGENGEDITSGTINNVPFDANYKTNIVGTLMTEKPSFNITINAAFATPDKVVVENAAAANAAFAAGETNVKINEITADAELVLPNTGAPVSIELPATDKAVSVIYSSESGAATPEVVNVIVPDGKNVAEVVVNAPESTVNIEGNVGDLTVYSADNTAYIKAGAKVGTVTVGKGNVVIEAGAKVTKVVRAEGNDDKYTLLSLGEGVVAPELGEKIYVVESFNVLTFAKFKTALADAEYEWDGKGAIVLLLESERNYQNNKTAQFFVGASNVNITDPVEKVKVSNVTFQFEDDAADNAYTSGELQVFAKTIGFTGCTFIGTAVSPWGKSNTENAETAEFVGCTWKNLSGRYGVHQNRASNLKVQDCTFENCERGIHTNSTTPAAITITGNTFTGIGAGYGAICLAENGNIGDAELEISGNTAEKQVFLRQLNKGVTLEQIAAIKKNNTYGTLYVDGSIEVVPVAKIGDVEYKSFAEAAAAAKAGDEIQLLADIEGDITVPAGVTLNGNGKEVQVLGAITAEGEITFGGVIKATNFGTKYTNTVVNIPAGASLQLTGTGRMIIGYGCTFNITGTIEDAKTADKATLTPSLKIAAGASITGNGVTFNVNNAYIVANSSTTSKNSNANGTFDFNINNSIWEQTGVLAFYVPSSGMDPVVNFELKNSVLTTTSHLVFSVTKGEVVIDNSLVNQGTSRQLENRSTMTIKNGSVVNGAVARSSNAKNPGTVIVENATYAVTGEFTGSDLGTGNIVFKNGANFTAGSITKANITIDAAGMTAGEVAISANLKDFTGELKVVNNNGFNAEIVDGKIVLVPPVAKIGEIYYATLSAAFAAVTDDNQEVVLLKDVKENLTSSFRGNITTENDAKVTIQLTNSDWVYCPYTFVLGENITLNVPALFYYAGASVINGTVVADAYYQSEAGTKLTINEPGSLTVKSETFILRYTGGDPNAGIYVNGDNKDTTIGLKLSVAYFYQGMINAKDADIQVGTYWQTNETDGQGSANLVLNNTNMNVTVNEHNFKATGNSTVTLENNSVINIAGGYEGVDAKVDETSSINIAKK